MRKGKSFCRGPPIDGSFLTSSEPVHAPGHSHKRAEAITSRPLLLHAIGRKTSHSNQATLTITSLHAEATKIQTAMNAVAGFLGSVRSIAAQLQPILRAVVRAFPLTPAMNGLSISFQTP